jgi:hypothetical protein
MMNLVERQNSFMKGYDEGFKDGQESARQRWTKVDPDDEGTWPPDTHGSILTWGSGSKGMWEGCRLRLALRAKVYERTLFWMPYPGDPS